MMMFWLLDQNLMQHLVIMVQTQNGVQQPKEALVILKNILNQVFYIILLIKRKIPKWRCIETRKIEKPKFITLKIF